MSSSKEAKKNCGSNIDLEEETFALQKKRSRRVSFAETTAVHLFTRDDDDEIPPNGAGENLSSEAEREPGSGRLSRRESEEIMELLQSSDESDDDGEDEVVVKRSFLRPMESPSPGSTFGSATSNDEDNFFGPVSMDFIKPRGFSDSAASDENHDITMDSTAFSMHFRSLARSDSGGEFKTPTGIRLAFDERTPGQISTTTGIGDFMVQTAPRKSSPHSSLPADKVNNSGHSDDMSLVSENAHSYDFGKLPPELDMLLAEAGKDVGSFALTSNVECSNPSSSLRKDYISASDQNRYEVLDLRDDKCADVRHVTNKEKSSACAIPVASTNIDKGIDSLAAATLCETTNNNSYIMDSDLTSKTRIDGQIKAPVVQTDVMPFDFKKESKKDGAVAGGKFASPQSRTQSNLDSEQSARPSFSGSVLSLLAKRGRIFKVSDNIIQNEPRDQESIKHILSASCFTKSASRLKMLETYPFASTSKVECNTSRLIPSGHLTRSMVKNILLGYRSKDISINHVGAPVARLDKLFSNVAENERECESLSEIDSNGVRSKDTEYARDSEDIVKDVELQFLSKDLPSHDRSTKITSSMVSPSFTDLQKKGLNHTVSVDSHAKGPLQSMTSDSSLPEITLNDIKYDTVTEMHDESVCPSANGMERMVSASPKCKGIPSMNLNQQFQSHIGGGRYVAENMLKFLESEYSSSLLFERKAETNLSSSDIVHSKDVAEESLMQNEDAMVSNSETPMCFQTPLMDKVSKSCTLRSLSDHGQTRRTLARSAKGLTSQSTKSFAGATANLDRPNELPIQVVESSTAERHCIPLREEQCDSRDDVDVHLFLGNDDATPRSNLITSKCDRNDVLLEKPFHVCGSNSSSGLKRKYGGLCDKVEEDNDNIILFQHNSKLLKHQNHCVEGIQVSHKIGGDATLRHWADVFTRYCETTQQLLSPWIQKLDLTLIGKLDDILLHLEKMKTYELLHSDISFQKALDFACLSQNKRMVEKKSLLYKTLYEKAKLQLLHLKRDKLLDQVQKLSSRVQESNMLMSSCQHSSVHCQKNIQVNGFQLDSCPTSIADKVLGYDDISSLRKELGVSDTEIKNLNDSLHTYFKVMKRPICIETTTFVKDYLKKRVSCRSLQSELQLCEVESLKTTNVQQNILIDHLGFMSQRLIVNSNATSGMSISNKLNSMMISRMFLNMDACTAFSFVLSGQNILAYTGLRTIAQETQKTNLLLDNLLDVVEEVKLAVLEVRNLTQSRFCQRPAGKLDLQLGFSDFKSGARVTLSIDITCLNRGIYPAEVLPYEVQGRAAGKYDALQQLLLTKIKTSLRGLRCGYMRIISICRCVSKTIQANNAMS